MMEWLATHSPVLIIAVPLFAAFLIPILDKLNHKARNALVLIAGVLTLVIALALVKQVFDHGIIIYTLGGSGIDATLPSGYTVPVRIVLEVDGMGAFMVLISVFISFVGLLYSFAHITRSDAGKYYVLYLLMLVGMLGMEVTGDLFNLFVFLEILSISSAGLIAFFARDGRPLEASIKYIVISTIAALFLLFAIGLLYGEYNLLNMAAIAAKITAAGSIPRITLIAFVLILSSFALKAGAAPMHMWLPDAYGEAPGAISMVLVAATMASLYALFRVCFTLFGVALDVTIIGIILLALGLVSLFIGVTMALIQIDLKRLIGYAAVAEIGYILLAVGAGFYSLTDTGLSGQGLIALQGGIFHMFNDVLDIGLLFLVAGAILYVTRESNINKLGGLAHSMKYSCFFFIIGLAAVSGLPPLNGFASKILIYESIYTVSPILSIVAILGSIIMLAIFVKIFHAVFLGPRLPTLATAVEAPKLMLASMAVLAAVMVFFGLFPEFILNNLVNPAVNALIEQATYIGAFGGV